MVDRVEKRANTSLVRDEIAYYPIPTRVKPTLYRDLYLNEGLTASQIASKLGSSKTSVLEKLRRQGIRNAGHIRTDPRNYTLHEPPYGFAKIDGRLTVNKSEMRTCRLVVELRSRQKMSFQEIATLLIERKCKNRNGKCEWNHPTIIRIFKRWNGKL